MKYRLIRCAAELKLTKNNKDIGKIYKKYSAGRQSKLLFYFCKGIKSCLQGFVRLLTFTILLLFIFSNFLYNILIIIY